MVVTRDVRLVPVVAGTRAKRKVGADVRARLDGWSETLSDFLELIRV